MAQHSKVSILLMSNSVAAQLTTKRLNFTFRYNLSKWSTYRNLELTKGQGITKIFAISRLELFPPGAKNYLSLYHGVLYIEVSYIEVPL